MDLFFSENVFSFLRASSKELVSCTDDLVTEILSSVSLRSWSLSVICHGAFRPKEIYNSSAC